MDFAVRCRKPLDAMRSEREPREEREHGMSADQSNACRDLFEAGNSVEALARIYRVTRDDILAVLREPRPRRCGRKKGED